MRNQSNNCSMCKEIDEPKGKYPLSGTIFCGKLNKYIIVEVNENTIIHRDAKTGKEIIGCKFFKKGLSRPYRRKMRKKYAIMGKKHPEKYDV